MYLHPKFERKKGVLPWLWITHWPLTFHIVQGLNKLWKIVIQEIYMACQHEDEPPMHSGKLANSSCWSGKEWRTKSPLHDGKKFWPKKNSMDRSVRPEIASRTNQGGCWICMQMPNFCYGIALLVDWLSTEYRRQSSEGYPTKVDWSVKEREIKNKKATETRVRQVQTVSMT